MKNGEYIMVVAPEYYPGKRYRQRYVYEHVLVWWLNTGEVINTKTHLVHHINENKHDNIFSNLELLTRSEHSKHHHPSGADIKDIRVISGCNNHRSSLKPEDVANIRRLLDSGVSLRSIAKQYECSHVSIIGIKHGRSYKYE
jgi:hypothetical protein